MTMFARRIFVAIALTALMAGAAEVCAEPLVNQLHDHASPYLALHAADPVAWQAWGPAVLERARREHKPIYLSIGYFSCHWCHVMQRESYRNPAIAAFLNQHFIPVKIDRELEPALDARMIAFAEATRGRSGWPLNVFVTPAGYPMHASLYLPADEFLAVLRRVEQLWREDPIQIERVARAADTAQSAPRQQPPSVAALATAVMTAVHAHEDSLQGGFGEQSKFPMVPQLQFLLAQYTRQPDPKLKTFLTLTLDQMAQRGLQDHLTGGFFRYTVDPSWSVPHFEKMLYDNALLARLYLQAARVFGREDYAATAERTRDFMRAVMRAPNGGLIAALSAVDALGVEGGYYLWNREELNTLLDKHEYSAYTQRYGMTGAAPFDAGFLPIPTLDMHALAAAMERSEDDVIALLASAEKKLRAARDRRVAPRDTKVLAGWNGLALVAYAEAARISGRAVDGDSARSVRDYIATRLWDGKNLRRAEVKGRTLGSVSLEDYAYVSAGLLAWAEYTGKEADFLLAKRVMDRAWVLFYGPKGWRHPAAHAVLPAMEAAGLTGDGPIPSPAGVLAQASLRLAKKYADPALRARALAAIRRNSVALGGDSFWHVTEIGVLYYE